MKIELSDGSISFAGGTLSPSQDRANFLASGLARGATQKVVNKEWWRIRVRPEAGVVATVVFQGERLDSVLLLMEIPADSGGHWTVENELNRKVVHDRWLNRELGRPPYRYDWGTVASEYDAKGCVSEIIVGYAR